MRSVLLMLMVSLTQVQLSLLCPASCVVCSEDAIICNKLSSIIEAPDSTKALMLTDGLIDTVDGIVFSDLSNMSVLVLSNNIISTIMVNAFQNLTVLSKLFLDHNNISSHSLDSSTFSWLRKLETLHLGNNALNDINGSWFQKTNALKTLLLVGNLLTSLNSSTFALSDLRNLETLNLSDNLITFVGRDSFRNLPRLCSLDLSRNRLQNAPDAFSYLSWLSMLNLDLNSWNCSCELKELAFFLNSYIQSPGKVLYNGQRMVCASSDNPSVQTVLELTKANCIPAKSNITVEVVAKNSIRSQRYIRDVALSAACSCLGGVVITLAVLAIVYRKLGNRLRPWQGKKGVEEQSSQTWDFSEGKEALSMSYALHNSNCHGHQPWDKEDTSSDSRPDTMENHFICPNCSSATLGTCSRRETFRQRTNCMGIQRNIEEDWSTHLGSDQWKDAKGHSVFPSRIKDVGAQIYNRKGIGGLNTHHFRGQENPQHGVSKDMSTMRMQQMALRRHISIAQRQTFTPEEQINSKMATHENHPFLKHQHEEYGTLPVYQTMNCFHCHQTYEYKQTGNIDRDSMFRNHKDGILSRGDRRSRVILYRDTLNYNQSNIDHQGEGQARVQRSVTFDLSMEHGLVVPSKEGPYRIGRTKMSKTLEQKSNPSLVKVSAKGNRSTTHRHSKIHKPRSQVNGKLKVKINLNIFRRSQVHPKSSPNHENKDVDKTSKKVKKDKLQKSKVRKDSDSHSKQKSKKDKTTKKSQYAESSNDPGETQNLQKSAEESVLLTQNSNLLAESTDSVTTQPLSTVNTIDPHQVTTPDLNLPVNTLEDASGPQEESTVPQDGGDLPSDSMTPMSTNLSVVQEYLSSGDGSPKRKIRLIIPEKTSSRPQTALEKKIR